MSKAFKPETAERLLRLLQASGMDPDASLGPDSGPYGGGSCTDAGCCPQREGSGLLAFTTCLSGDRLSTLAKGLTDYPSLLDETDPAFVMEQMDRRGAGMSHFVPTSTRSQDDLATGYIAYRDTKRPALYALGTLWKPR